MQAVYRKKIPRFGEGFSFAAELFICRSQESGTNSGSWVLAARASRLARPVVEAAYRQAAQLELGRIPP